MDIHAERAWEPEPGSVYSSTEERRACINCQHQEVRALCSRSRPNGRSLCWQAGNCI